MSSAILVVDDHAPNREFIREALDDSVYEISEAQTASDALEHLRRQETDLVITDVRMPGISGVELLKRLHNQHPNIVVILVSAFATVASAVEAMKLGAHDYLTRPIEIDELRLVIQQALEYHRTRIERRHCSNTVGQRRGFESILGNSKALMGVLEQATRAARTNSTVLIQGETGTGKELLARGIHALSARSIKPFVTINCGAIPKDLLESELFGHVKGAFTGACTDRKGQVEAADGGTLFLDEIGEMSPELQVKLLRFIQNGEIHKVGAVRSIKVNVRVLAATHRDLAAMVHEGKFREDLYYRLNVIPLRLPGLRDRREDIPELMRFFFEHSCSKHGCPDLSLGHGVLERFLAYQWPGNIRELENIVERIVILTCGSEVGITDLPQFLQPDPNPVQAIRLDLPPNGICFGGLEKEVLLRALELSDWNQSMAAPLLGMSRKTLAYRVHKYNLLRRCAISRYAGTRMVR
ncbi:sigma-54-dependent transcriptional regulator [Edaphobacter aggregans]|uniref:sigma-54-dependent transcriptional regulator n=1 Tax=Edaphobacter aggregans TaxID=570835 RepID=UPI00054DB742|nr:sigma-54 dependent transcriptional regulator [Edaphobacter aggregans]